MVTEKRRSALQTRLAGLEERLSGVTKDITKTLSSDFAEQATERENDDVLEEIGRETRSSIQHLRAALQRMDEDGYGICASCGKEISAGRLDAIPESTFCVSCAD
jgi:DnaK suppressor protein